MIPHIYLGPPHIHTRMHPYSHKCVHIHAKHAYTCRLLKMERFLKRHETCRLSLLGVPVALSTFTHCTTPPHLSLELLCSWKKLCPLNSNSSLLPSLVIATGLFHCECNAIHMRLTLDIFYEWRHLNSSFLLPLAFFTYVNVFKAHSCCCMYTNPGSFHGWLVSHRVYALQTCYLLLIHSSVGGHLAALRLFAVVNSAAMDIGV